MSAKQVRYVRQHEISPAATWQLAEFVLAHGADEFALDLMRLEGDNPPMHQQFLADFLAFSRGEQLRECLTVLVGHPAVDWRRVWQLTDESLARLRPYFEDGLFDYMNGTPATGWLEDPTFYRKGEVVLGIVSHEGEGWIAGSAEEVEALERMGLCLRPTA